ncbi:S8 family serine peptidase [Cupriavidus sp. AcVe19-6a]|uniref:S8 family serine peptidase n=1 Tax=Cupriavidus sp. AcVe19-6a TaxID=2821358 RepID=UPI001AE5E54C|nr:S8 family serine peptidase [Cupriavidus sp. AcVe19-6a]MBP0639452.1 S8 family serine peptidase [Cupriavidus sp. AcVe19-6a]
MTEGDNRKLHPRLRVIENRNDRVNATAAVLSGRLASSASLHVSDIGATAAKSLRACERFTVGTLPGAQVPVVKRPPPRPKMSEVGPAKEAYVNVFIETANGDPGSESPVSEVARKVTEILANAQLPPQVSRKVMPRRNFISVTVPVAALSEISTLPGVTFVQAAESLSIPLPVTNGAGGTLRPTPRAVISGGKRLTGDKVLIGIIDVGGFDFAHEDFLDATGNTRFVAIWDQGGDFRPPPQSFGYGSELTEARLAAAVRQQREGGLPAVELERQSQRSTSSHGTHVASIAAGSNGVCPGARIAAVLVSLPVPETDREQRRWTFSDSSRIIDAIEYLYELGQQLGLPVSINISLGTNGGAHDGSNGPCRWIDASLSVPGRAITVAAGNAGQEDGATPDDLGWLMGRIHTMGRVQSRGLDIDLEWVVVGDGVADFSENELEIWYAPQDRMTVSVQPPGSSSWFTIAPREYIQNKRLDNGTVLSIYSELYHPTNGDNYIAIYLSPNLNPDTLAPVVPGVWKVRLHGDEIRSGHFHAWIERDDPMELDRLENLRAYRFPSFFTKASNVDSHSIGSLACAHRVVGVANVDVVNGRVNISSSQGPTRDGRSKPDIAAPGTEIVAANGFGGNDTWVSMTGTSMASPYVCGVIGLMLAAKPSLNAAQCEGILKRTAKPLPSHGYEWRNDVGFGVIDPAAAIAEALVFDNRDELR